MNARCATLVSALASVATLFFEPFPVGAQTVAEVGANFSFAGTWDGKMNGLPGITLRIDEAGGKVSGTVLLYFQVGNTIRLLVPQVHGKALTFEVQRHKCQGCEEFAPNAKFRMELSKPNEASLWMIADGAMDKPQVQKSS